MKLKFIKWMLSNHNWKRTLIEWSRALGIVFAGCLFIVILTMSAHYPIAMYISIILISILVATFIWALAQYIKETIGNRYKEYTKDMKSQEE